MTSPGRNAPTRATGARGLGSDGRLPVEALFPLALTVNGHPRQLTVAPHHTLLEVLRDDLRLTGTKECCLVGECGACTVILDGRSVDSCLVLVVEADGGTVTTVEGLAAEAGAGSEGGLAPLQQAFLATSAAQCGFCIPGQLMAAHALLGRVPRPSRAEVEEGLAGNLCRCAGYEQIIEAVLLAAEADAAGPDLAGDLDRRERRPAREARAHREPPTRRDGPDPAAVPDAKLAPQ